MNEFFKKNLRILTIRWGIIIPMVFFVFVVDPRVLAQAPLSVPKTPQPLSQNHDSAPWNTGIAQKKAVPVIKTQDARRVFPIFRNAINKYQPFYFFMFIGGFIMLAVIRIINPSYLKNLLASTFNLKLLMHLFKEGIFGFNIINLLLDILCVSMLSIGVQIYFFVNEPHYFLWILSFITMAYVLKLIAIQLLANIFLGKAEALIHLLLHLLLTRFLGLILLPILFVTLYQPVFDVNTILRVLMYCIGIFYVAWMLRLFIQMKSMSTSGMIYLFLYLCTIEISPLVVLLKVSIR